MINSQDREILRRLRIGPSSVAQCTNCGRSKMFHVPHYQPIVNIGGVIFVSGDPPRKECKEFESKHICRLDENGNLIRFK